MGGDHDRSAIMCHVRRHGQRDVEKGRQSDFAATPHAQHQANTRGEAAVQTSGAGRGRWASSCTGWPTSTVWRHVSVTASRNHTAPPVESGTHSAGGVQGGVLTAAVVTAAAVTSIVAARESRPPRGR